MHQIETVHGLTLIKDGLSRLMSAVHPPAGAGGADRWEREHGYRRRTTLEP